MNESILKAYAIATSGGIQLPSRIYLREIADELNVSLTRARELAETYKRNKFKPSNTTIQISDALYLGMFNAVLDTKKTVNIANLRDRIVQNGFKEVQINGFKYKSVKMTTRFGKFKPASNYTKEYGLRKLAPNVTNNSLSSIEFLIKISKGTKVQGASFSIFNTGLVRFSGGYIDGISSEPKQLVEYVDELLNLNMKSEPIRVNNITSNIKIGAKVNIEELYSLLDVEKGLAKFEGYVLSATFEPTRNLFIVKQRKNSPFLYVKFNDSFTVLIAQNGTIVVEGTEAPTVSFEIVNKFINFLNIAGLLTVNQRNISHSPKKSKLARREDNKPAPDITRRGSTCPIQKRPNPYSFQGECPGGKNFYVRPNPQGQPCCYRIPKRLDYIRNKVKNRYVKADVKIPEKVKRIFGIVQTDEKAPNVGKIKPQITVNKNKLGSRQCMRYTKVSLVDIATRLGLVVPSKVTKTQLCKMISENI